MIEEFNSELRKLVLKRNFPCVAAVKSIVTSDFESHFGGELGRGEHASELAIKLKAFKEKQRQSRSIYSTFFCVFEEAEYTEEEFETAMWAELSFLSAAAGGVKQWDPKFSSDPADPDFCFSLDNEAFFIVGMHSNSSREGRRISRPTIVFNLYEQFEELDRQGQYHAMVEANRNRDTKFQGNVNPMVELYGDKWESIQFSGRNNDSQWKCPFQHLHSKTNV